MQDFIRIGGPITSAPLNEDFRRLLNAISMANVNLVFPEDNAVVNTITDMMAISNPENGQTCYVVSSGEFYRYSKGDKKWHMIMDIGETFRQGFLNSGAVVLEGPIEKDVDSNRIIKMPSMLVYFKNKPGDERYLKGMYLIEAKDLDITGKVDGANAYSILVDYKGDYSLVTGLPKQDDVNNVFIGTIIVDKNNNIIDSDFVYTLPDMAYTADRGNFILNGGQAKGMYLTPSTGIKVNRTVGYYYDEGINYPTGSTSDFPVDSDNGSNFDLKKYESKTDIENIYYMAPTDGLNYGVSLSEGIIYNKYWNNEAKELTNVPEGYFTIQQHLVTPNGQDIILYGNKLYNSITDAASNINSVFGIDIDFPCVETSRIVVGNPESGVFSTDNNELFRVFSLDRLAQLGTISPEFADNNFKVYSGRADDVTPATIRFNLDALEDENFNSLYSLSIKEYGDKRDYFALNSKFITDEITDTITPSEDYYNKIDNMPGYIIPTQISVDDLKTRVENIEKEIWEVERANQERYNQSIRFRIFNLEVRADEVDIKLANHEERLTSVEENKVNKATTINRYKLGDTTAKNEIKDIVLQTGDIEEGEGLTGITNLWYTEGRVNNNERVLAGYEHSTKISAGGNATGHIVVNPHNLSTDDINILTDTNKIFVTPEEERRIRADRLPENTIQALQDLDDKNMDSLDIKLLDGNSKNPGLTPEEFGSIRELILYKDGVNISLSEDGQTATLECLGQVDENSVMTKAQYATVEQEFPEEFEGYVDNSINSEYAKNISGMDAAGINKYYGTNEIGYVGIHDLPKRVTTADMGAYTDIDQVTFVPIDGSVLPKHLDEELKNVIYNNYHTVYENGVFMSDEVNTINFGNNLSVVVNDHSITVNATGEGGEGVSSFVNLDDVNVTYSGNEGKSLVVNDEGTGIVLANTPSLSNYMLKGIYTDPTDISKVKKAVRADRATVADTATNALALSGITIDNTATDATHLWTASQIISNTTTLISQNGMKAYSGTTVPSDSLGKDGDIYVLIES